MVYTHHDKVYLSDTDCTGFAYHKAYFDWAEHARSEILRMYNPETSVSYAEVIPVILGIDIQYFRPLRIDDELTVLSEAFRIQRFSAFVNQKIMKGDMLSAELMVRFAFIDAETRKPHPIPDKFKAALLGEDL